MNHPTNPPTPHVPPYVSHNLDPEHPGPQEASVTQQHQYVHPQDPTSPQQGGPAATNGWANDGAAGVAGYGQPQAQGQAQGQAQPGGWGQPSGHAPLRAVPGPPPANVSAYTAEAPIDLRAPMPGPSTAPPVPPQQAPATPSWGYPGGYPDRAAAARPVRVPATWGWRARLHRPAGRAELLHRQAVAAAQASFPAPRTIVVANPKGGAGKTPTTLTLAATLAQLRTESTVAWDINETRGTLGLRAAVNQPETTIVDVLNRGAWLVRPDAAAGDLTGMLRRQPDGSMVLASTADATFMRQINGEHVQFVKKLLERRFAVLVADTGNNTAAPGFIATAAGADALVIPTGPASDHIAVVWQLLEGLHNRDETRHLVGSAVLVVTSPSGAPLAPADAEQLGQVVGRVMQVPADPAIARGGRLAYDDLSPASRRAWTLVAAAVADVCAQPSPHDDAPYAPQQA